MSQVLNKIRERFPLRKTLLIILLIGGVLIIPQIAQGQEEGGTGFFQHVVDVITGPVQNMAIQFGNAIIRSIFTVLNGLSSVILGFATSFLQWTISDGFMGKMGYTPQTNFIIESGWVAMRNLANMFFIIALVVIGIATALRYKEYQAQKALPRLIIIALLINFTPPILAFIINSFNTIMQALLPSGFGEVIAQDFSALWTGWKVEDFAIGVGRAMGIFFFNFIAAFIFLVYGFVFMLRHIVLWMLIIISPLAFMGYIFPSTSKYVKQWWGLFIQWCSVGVLLSLTIYLCNTMLGKTEQFGAPSLGETSTGADLGIFSAVVPYFIPLAFLVIGFLMAVKINDAIPDVTTQTAKVAGAATIGATAKAGKRTAEWSKSRTSEEEMKDMGTAGEYTARMGNTLRSGAQKFGGYASRATPEPVKKTTKQWAAKGGKALTERLREEGGRPTEFLTRGLLTESERMREEREQAKNRTVEENARNVADPTTQSLIKSTSLEQLAQQGEINTAKEIAGLTDQQITEVAQKSAREGRLDQAKNIIKGNSTLAPEIAEGLNELEEEELDKLNLSTKNLKEYFDEDELQDLSDKQIKRKGLKRQVTAQMDLKDLENLDPGLLQDEDVMDSFNRNLGPREWSKVAREFGREAVNALNNNMKSRQWYVKHEQENLANWIESTGGRRAGIKKEFPKGEGEGEGAIEVASTRGHRKKTSKDEEPEEGYQEELPGEEGLQE